MDGVDMLSPATTGFAYKRTFRAGVGLRRGRHGEYEADVYRSKRDEKWENRYCGVVQTIPYMDLGIFLQTKKRGRNPSIPLQDAPVEAKKTPPKPKRAPATKSKKDQEDSSEAGTNNVLTEDTTATKKPPKTKKRAKRSSEEIQRLVEERESVRRQMEALKQKDIMIAAVMEANDADAEDEEEAGAVHCLADIEEEMDTREKIEEEAIDGDVDVEMREILEGNEEVSPTKGKGKSAAQRKTKKMVKGELHGAINEVKTKLAAAKIAAGKKPAISNKVSSGFAPNWKAKIAADDLQPSTSASITFGGLEDVDLAQEWLSFDKGVKVVHQNELVTISDADSNSEVEVFTPTPKTKPNLKAQLAKPMPIPRLTPALIKSKPLVKVNLPHSASIRKSAPLAPIPVKAEATLPKTPADHSLPAGDEKLPLFIRARWDIFLATSHPTLSCLIPSPSCPPSVECGFVGPIVLQW
ncbi:hypothetical protein JAAARDRAFT_49607 [Jaapia argillacea MUCL 33604]|uniref:Uncharacterized protein n=1 Tax=Jaapia argillacea MUCL 33604 TaxID=933084 RepID=A0A067PQU3_9AGAM|nr:hypothetical protein JAAARDRAFT_49607 [Jaapia argillacea MUCL 33604]